MTFYGTAVKQTPGQGAPGQPSTPLGTVVWCEQAGCPASQCAHCAKEKS